MILLVFMMLIALARVITSDPAGDQLPWYKINSTCPVVSLTTSAGAPVVKAEADYTLDDISLFNNEYYRDTYTHFTSERIPERIVHSKGAGAYGYFEVTRNITHICKADLFSYVGKRTKIAVRFSTVGNELDISDTKRGTRAMGVKFYTKEGNFDVITINTPMFSFKDPLLFMPGKHSGTRNPTNNLLDVNALWDFTTLNPETLFATIYIFGDRGIPLSFRHIPGYSVHTYEVVNAKGKSYYVRFHFIPDLGIQTLSSEEAIKIGLMDRDSFTRDLYNSIGSGNYPSWTVSLQILSYNDVKNAKFDVFDVTRILPEDIYPLTDVGRLVLNKNVLNTFAEVEQMALCPSNLVPGIPGPPDVTFQSRRLAYRNAHFYRLGPNFNKLPINRPIGTKVSTYLRDGQGPDDNEKDHPNYRPNSFCGPVAQDNVMVPKLLSITEKKAYNFDQANKLINEMSTDEQNRVIENFVLSLGPVSCFLQERVIKLMTQIDSNVGKKIAAGVYAQRGS